MRVGIGQGKRISAVWALTLVIFLTAGATGAGADKGAVVGVMVEALSFAEVDRLGLSLGVRVRGPRWRVGLDASDCDSPLEFGSDPVTGHRRDRAHRVVQAHGRVRASRWVRTFPSNRSTQCSASTRP